jgi:hypothetical protein
MSFDTRCIDHRGQYLTGYPLVRPGTYFSAALMIQNGAWIFVFMVTSKSSVEMSKFTPAPAGARHC